MRPHFYKDKRSWFIAGAVMLIATLCLAFFSSPATHTENGAPIGKWTLVLGSVGNGSSTQYIFDFNDDKTLNVEKQDKEGSVSATGTYAMDGEKIKVTLSNTPQNLIEASNLVLVPLNETAYGTLIKDSDGNDRKAAMNYYNGLLSGVHVFAVFFVLIAILELARHYRWFAWLFYTALPIAATPYWASTGLITSFFRWEKLYTQVAGTLIRNLMRFTRLANYAIMCVLVLGLFALNISEAVIQDGHQGMLPNLLNAGAGLLCIATFGRWKDIQPTKTKERDFLWPGMTKWWIIGYDIWNFTFVYLNFPETSAFHFMVLAAATIPCMFIRQGTYPQARGYTLCAWMIYLFFCQKFIITVGVPLPRSYGLMVTLGAISLTVMLGYAIMHFRWLITKKAPAKINVGQNLIAYHIEPGVGDDLLEFKTKGLLPEGYDEFKAQEAANRQKDRAELKV